MVVNKINEIMKKIGYVKKDTTIDMGGKGSYNALSERKVLQSVRPFLVENGIVIIPIEITQFERFGSITMAAVKYKIVDTEDGDSETMASIGQGMSTGDKGANSALTYATKNLIVKMLLLESGDDPERVADVKHDKELEDLSSIAAKLTNEVGLLSQGGKVLPQQATGMVAYINKNSHDPGILRQIEEQINQIKNQ